MKDRTITEIYEESLKQKAVADEYCKNRGIKNPDFGYLRFLQYQNRVIVEVIVIPIRDAQNKLVMLELRSLKFKEHYKIVDDPSYHIYNIQNAIQNTDYVIVTEGVFDAESLIQQGYNTIATLTASIPVATKHILTIFDKIILAYDNDSAGVKSMKELTEFYRASYGDNEVDILEYEGKDLNECLMKGAIAQIQNEMRGIVESRA